MVPASNPESVAELTSTWPGFLDVAKKLTNPDEQRWAIGSASDVVYSNFAHRNLFDADWNCAVNSERAVQLLTYAQDMRVLASMPRSATGRRVADDAGQRFDRHAVWRRLVWRRPEGLAAAGRRRSGKANGASSRCRKIQAKNWAGSFLAIPEQSENKEAAWTFIEFALARADSQNKMFAAVDYFPAYIPAFDDPMYQEADPFFGGQQTRAMWVDIAANKIQPFITTPMDAQAEQIFMSYVNKALDQGLDPQTTLDEACIEIEQQTAPDKEEALKLRQ